MTPEEFRRLGYELVDWIAEMRGRVAAGEPPVMSQVAPGWLRERLPDAPPERGEPFHDIVRDTRELLPPALSHFLHPSFFGYFPCNGELASVLADLVATGLGQLGLNWASSPALTELEEVTTDWLRQMLGLSDAWRGVIQDTASTATLVALICAREHATGHAAVREGIQGERAPLTVYVSRYAHSSVDKAALLAGFGQASLRHVDVDEAFALRPEALAAAIREDLAQGRKPACIVATVGTTATTAVDPVRAVADIAAEHRVWLHVDAALAGSAMILPEHRQLWDGVEQADSLVVNPHKWLGVSFDCSTYYVRNPEHLIRVMSSNPSYLQTAHDAEALNYRDWGVPLGRRFRAIKLWYVLRERGVAGLQARLRRDIENARWLAGRVAQTPGWKVLAPVPLQTVCVRHEPAGVTGDDLDAHTLAWVRRINDSGKAYVTPAKLEGRWMVRVSIGALPTERAHVEALWALMQDAAGRGDP
jgi:aromatic-L-amino-acid decarboxylase